MPIAAAHDNQQGPSQCSQNQLPKYIVPVTTHGQCVTLFMTVFIEVIDAGGLLERHSSEPFGWDF